MTNCLTVALAYLLTRCLSRLIHSSVASRVNDGLANGDTGVRFDETVGWTYDVLNGK